MNRLLAALLAAALNSRAYAAPSTTSPPTVGYSSPDITGATVTTRTGTVIPIGDAALSAGNQFDVKLFGAIGDGTVHHVSNSVASGGLGVSTVAGLQSYVQPQGKRYAGVKLYAGLNTGTWMKQLSIRNMGAQTAAGTTIPFGKAVTVSKVDSNNSTTLILMGPGGVSGTRPGFVVTPISSTLSAGTYRISQMVPQYTDGQNNGFVISGSPAAGPTVGDTLQVSPDLTTIATALAAGKTVAIAGGSIPAGDTITAVNTTPGAGYGTITLASATTSAVGSFNGFDVSIPYTDAEVAAMSMDSLGINAAMQYAAANNGGAVHLSHSAGSYMLTDNLVLPVSNQTTIGNGQPVDLLGVGENASSLQMTQDLGYGGFAIACPYRVSQNQCFGRLEDLTLYSSNPSAYNAGTSNVLMGGLSWGGRRTLDNLMIRGFSDGVAVAGDQTQFRNVSTYDCYAGFDWDVAASAASFGVHDNWVFSHILMGQNLMAGFLVGPNIVINGSLFDHLVFGLGPFGILKELTGSQGTLMSDVQLDVTQCEIVGVACVADDRPWATPNASTDNLTRVNFAKLEFQTGISSAPLTAYGLGNATAVFSLGAFVHVRVEPMDTFNWSGVAEGLFNVASAEYGAEIDGDIQSTLLTAGNGNFFGPIAADGYGWQINDINWHAHVLYSAASVVNYELNCLPVTSVSGSATGTNGNVQACSGAAGDDVMGYAIEVSGASGQMHMLIDHGLISPNSTNGHLVPVTTSNFYPYGPQMACTASGGGVQAGLGRSCPNGGVPVGTLLRNGPAFFEINTGTSS